MLVLRRGLQAVRACWPPRDTTGSTLGFCHFQRSGAGGGGLWFIFPLNTAVKAQTLGKGDENLVEVTERDSARGTDLRPLLQWDLKGLQGRLQDSDKVTTVVLHQGQPAVPNQT